MEHEDSSFVVDDLLNNDVVMVHDALVDDALVDDVMVDDVMVHDDLVHKFVFLLFLRGAFALINEVNLKKL